jgi:predicted RNase H-like nuclease (RuvC/YqgF family)
VVTGNSLENVLEQTVNNLEDKEENKEESEEEDGKTKDIKEIVYDGAKEYNQEVDNMMSNNVEIKSNPLDNKTELEEVFDEFIDEYDRIVKKAINSVK